jgi:hypothetical protein
MLECPGTLVVAAVGAGCSMPPYVSYDTPLEVNKTSGIYKPGLLEQT